MADGGAVQWGLDGVMAVITALVGLILRNIRDDHKGLREAHDEFVGEAQRTFAQKEDVRDSFNDVKTTMKSMNDKLDRLLERRYGGPER